MGENHLTYFKVENFKRFKSFEMNDIGQFNLIVGDNNVGKTSVLEALCFNVNLNFILSALLAFKVIKGLKTSDRTNLDALNPDFILGNYLKREQGGNVIQYSFYLGNVSSTITLVIEQVKNFKKEVLQKIKDRRPFLDVDNDETWLYTLEVNDSLSDVISVEHFSHLNFHNIKSSLRQFVPLSRFYDEDLLGLYSIIDQIPADRILIIEDLKTFIPNIKDIRTIDNLIQIEETSKNNLLPIASYGDGANKLFRILLQLRLAENSRLMIDEIDAGIHYSRFKDFWRTIIKAAIRNDVQIFATTHNLECLKYFKEVLEEPEMKEFQEKARCFSLIEQDDKSVKAFTSKFEQFQWAIDSENEIRGGW